LIEEFQTFGRSKTTSEETTGAATLGVAPHGDALS